jgi:hypothetical protein
MSPKPRGLMLAGMPVNFIQKLRSNYLWSLSKAGLTTIDPSERVEPGFSQAMGQYAGIDVCARKGIYSVH